MERKQVYTIFPAPPTSPTSHMTNRPPTANQLLPPVDESPYPPPSDPLPALPNPAGPLQKAPVSNSFALQQHPQLPPTPESLTPVRRPSRRKQSPNREFAEFQRELAQSARRAASPSYHRPPSSSDTLTNRPGSAHIKIPARTVSTRSRQSVSRNEAHPTNPGHAMHTSTLSDSSSSSLSLSKPPVLSPTSTVAPTPPPSTKYAISSQDSHHSSRPGHGGKEDGHGVFFHGGIGGAGNYRKVKGDQKTPRAYAPNVEPARKPSPSRFISNMFSNNSNNPKDRSRNPTSTLHTGASSLDERASGSERSFREDTANLGAAEVLKRKMISAGRRRKGGGTS